MMHLLALFFLFTFPPKLVAQEPRLEILVQDAASDKGMIRVLIFADGQGFPASRKQAIHEFSVEPNQGSAIVKLSDLPAGTYAISAIHDEDENGKLNTNLVGYPTEKYGFSNNPRSYLGPPAFDKVAFDYSGKDQKIIINLR